MEPYFLIAVPQLKSPYFFQSVVFVVNHNEDGAFGFVINRLLPNTLNELFTELQWDVRLPSEQQLLWGGPVGDGSCFLLSPDSIGMNNPEGSSNQETVEALLEKKQYFDMIVGYAGWGPEQLEKEIEMGTWLFTDISLKEMLDTPVKDRYTKALESLDIDIEALWNSPTFKS